MRLADARALDPTLAAIPADLAGDLALLKRLARWAGRWSPGVALAGDDSLTLDVTGAAHLFGGEERLLADVAARCTALGLATRAAIAPTARAAWALARFGAEPLASCPPDRAAAMLAPLPVAALGLPGAVSRVLERLGLKTIGALAGIERRSLARRFREADNPLDALDRALGRKADPIATLAVEHPPRTHLRLAEPVAHPEAAAQSLELMLPELARLLEQRRLGARRLVLAAFRSDGAVETALAAASVATRDAAHWKRLLADKAASLDPGFGFDGFVLEAAWTEPLGAEQGGLIEAPPGSREVALLVDRLGARLGPGRVRRPVARASHVPERASGWVAATSSSQSRSDREDLKRPQRLLDRPEGIAVIYATPEGLPRRFVWRRKVHDVARAEGPERIAPEWWRERSTARARDYYRVEDGEGRRYWIFREGIHGDGRGGDPAWYLHGLFG
jgi:protein ImuB